MDSTKVRLEQQINGTIFDRYIAPYYGSYRFRITQVFPRRKLNGEDLYNNFNVEIPSILVKFVPTEDGRYSLEIKDETFQRFEDEADRLGCDLFVYPRFL
jgi:hypothetical protein